jgi:hypothetical protein
LARVVAIDRIDRKRNQQVLLPDGVDRGKHVTSANFDADRPG